VVKFDVSQNAYRAATASLPLPIHEIALGKIGIDTALRKSLKSKAYEGEYSKQFVNSRCHVFPKLIFPHCRNRAR